MSIRSSSPIFLCLALFLAVSPPAIAADVMSLRQDILRLERELQMQQMAIQRLEHQLMQRLPPDMAPRYIVLEPEDETAEEAAVQWLDAEKWQRVEQGMTTLEVVAILGEPTSTRPADEGDATKLFYTLELSGDAWLSGQVVIADDRVVSMTVPTLR